MSEREKPDHEEIVDQLLSERKPFRVSDYAEDLGVGIEVVTAAIDQLRESGYTFQKIEDFWLRSRSRKAPSDFDLSDRFGRELHFGIVSDSHLGSKYERLDELEAMYDIFEAEGVGIVFHAGDLTDGVGVYRGQEFEVTRHGQESQIIYTKKKYPRRKGIDTYFITGNHDLRQYERGGVDVGVPIGTSRRDMHYLGQAINRVTLKDGVNMELLHPDGSVAYALSYKAQRDINNRSPNDLPHILVYGHYHTSFYMNYRGIDFVQAPCFKEAGIWEKRKGLNPTIGGWVVDAKVTEDHQQVERFRPDLFTFNNAPK